MKPLKFEPLLKSTIWGGNKIIAFKHLDIKQEKVGESWEISGVPGNESIVADGEMKGKKLNEVVAELKENFLGAENYKRFGNEFPLLIKFIDANTDLSIQVHPNDEIAKKQGKERGKTEMWYALPSEPDAKLYNGLKMQITPEQYKEMVENDTITDALAQYNVKEDDCFFIPAGRIHAIGILLPALKKHRFLFLLLLSACRYNHYHRIRKPVADVVFHPSFSRVCKCRISSLKMIRANR